MHTTSGASTSLQQTIHKQKHWGSICRQVASGGAPASSVPGRARWRIFVAMSSASPTSSPAAAAAEAAGSSPVGSRAARTGRSRVLRPDIDLDGSIRTARATIAAAHAAISKARTQARNDKRKKARLIKKASGLSSSDLERIAVLKRCGLWTAPTADAEPTSAGAFSGENSASPAGDSGNASASSGGSQSIPVIALGPTSAPAAQAAADLSEIGHVEHTADSRSEEGMED
jgi:hypothetical protein